MKSVRELFPRASEPFVSANAATLSHLRKESAKSAVGVGGKGINGTEAAFALRSQAMQRAGEIGRDGKPYTVRYEEVNAMLLNEFLKEHRKNEQQESKIEQQDAKIARQQKQIEALTAGPQKVSAQFEASKPAPQVVNNP